jgi:hypothetical protein
LAQQAHMLAEQHSAALEAERRVWQQRLETQQSEMQALREQLASIEETHQTLSNEVSTARSANGTLKRQLHSTLELVTGHGERVQSYAMKLAVLEQAVDKIEGQTEHSFVRRYAWTLLTTLATAIAVSIALLSSGVAIASGRLRAIDVVRRARREAEVVVAEVAPAELLQADDNANNDDNDKNLVDPIDSPSIENIDTIVNNNDINNVGVGVGGGSSSTPTKTTTTTTTIHNDSPSSMIDDADKQSQRPSSRTTTPQTTPQQRKRISIAPLIDTPTASSSPATSTTTATTSTTTLTNDSNNNSSSPLLRRRRVPSATGRRTKLSDYIDEIKFGE